MEKTMVIALSIMVSAMILGISLTNMKSEPKREIINCGSSVIAIIDDDTITYYNYNEKVNEFYLNK